MELQSIKRVPTSLDLDRRKQTYPHWERCWRCGFVYERKNENTPHSCEKCGLNLLD